ncbi:RND superfamily efflux pump MFP component [Halioglobus pacificus]|uniref:RND superfamily efflux pump MFP component n=2 Tax=Parahalioglobus pacificus TaxID=930806 RepID=A0A919CJZ6_9GAMM|nr:RND superfamily efflux pump MFP component [Halioglobus pacificus]
MLFLSRPETEIAEPVYKPVTVDAAEVVMEKVRIPVSAQGTVAPMQQTSLQSEVRGRVVEVSDNFNVGGFVAEGETLLRVDPRDYQTDLLRAQAALESAESALAQERGRAEVARREWEQLPKGSQRSDEARDLYLRKPQLEQAEAQLLFARADLETAQDNLDRTIIRAPYDAIIQAKNSELGQFLNVGASIAEVVGVSMAEVRLPIPQSRLPYLNLPGVTGKETNSQAAIDLYTDNGEQRQHWPARLHRTEGSYDQRSRSLFTVARVQDPYGLKNTDQTPLRFGSFVSARILGKSFDNIVVLPRYLLRAGNELWVIGPGNILQSRAVSILKTGGDLIYITDGLSDGEIVSLTSLDSSFRGAEVDIQSSTPSNQLHGDGTPAGDDPAVPAEEATVTITPPEGNAG